MSNSYFMCLFNMLLSRYGVFESPVAEFAVMNLLDMPLPPMTISKWCIAYFAVHFVGHCLIIFVYIKEIK